MVKRYINTLYFSLLALKGEVNIVDAMLIEGIRVFYPDLFNVIKNHSNIFLDSVGSCGNKDKERARKLGIIEKGFKGLNETEISSVKALLKALFPYTTELFDNVGYSTSEEKWVKAQRVASKYYFKRYLAYTVPDGDVSDQEIEAFLDSVDKQTITAIRKNIKKLIGENGADSFVMKMRNKVKAIPPDNAKKLVVSLMPMGSIFPNPEAFLSLVSAFSQVSILMSELIKSMDTQTKRLSLANKVIKESDPISFAHEVFKWIYLSDKDNKSQRLFSENEENAMRNILASRINKLC
jgi:hypothetical protein